MVGSRITSDFRNFENIFWSIDVCVRVCVYVSRYSVMLSVSFKNQASFLIE